MLYITRVSYRTASGAEKVDTVITDGTVEVADITLDFESWRRTHITVEPFENADVNFLTICSRDGWRK